MPNKGIEQACSWASCDIHIGLSPFSKIYALTFSNVLLVLALNFMAHKSSYCMQFSMMSNENLSFIYNLNTSHPNEIIPAPICMQVIN